MIFKVGDIVKFKDGEAGGQWVGVWYSQPCFIVEPIDRRYEINNIVSINVSDEDGDYWSMDVKSYGKYLEYAIILPNMEKVAVSLP